MGCVKFSSVEVPAEANYKECMMQALGDKCQSCLTNCQVVYQLPALKF